jgi:hypothetical protein
VPGGAKLVTHPCLFLYKSGEWEKQALEEQESHHATRNHIWGGKTGIENRWLIGNPTKKKEKWPPTGKSVPANATTPPVLSWVPFPAQESIFHPKTGVHRKESFAATAGGHAGWAQTCAGKHGKLVGRTLRIWTSGNWKRRREMDGKAAKNQPQVRKSIQHPLTPFSSFPIPTADCPVLHLSWGQRQSIDTKSLDEAERVEAAEEWGRQIGNLRNSVSVFWIMESNNRLIDYCNCEIQREEGAKKLLRETEMSERGQCHGHWERVGMAQLHWLLQLLASDGPRGHKLCQRNGPKAGNFQPLISAVNWLAATEAVKWIALPDKTRRLLNWNRTSKEIEPVFAPFPELEKANEEQKAKETSAFGSLFPMGHFIVCYLPVSLFEAKQRRRASLSLLPAGRWMAWEWAGHARSSFIFLLSFPLLLAYSLLTATGRRKKEKKRRLDWLAMVDKWVSWTMEVHKW